MNRKHLRALTLAVPTMNNPVLDPLAVLPLDNRLYMYIWVLYLKEFSYKMFSWTMEKA